MGLTFAPSKSLPDQTGPVQQPSLRVRFRLEKSTEYANRPGKRNLTFRQDEIEQSGFLSPKAFDDLELIVPAAVAAEMEVGREYVMSFRPLPREGDEIRAFEQANPSIPPKAQPGPAPDQAQAPEPDNTFNCRPVYRCNIPSLTEPLPGQAGKAEPGPVEPPGQPLQQFWLVVLGRSGGLESVRAIDCAVNECDAQPPRVKKIVTSAPFWFYTVLARSPEQAVKIAAEWQKEDLLEHSRLDHLARAV